MLTMSFALYIYIQAEEIPLMNGLSWEAEDGLIKEPFIIQDGYVFQKTGTNITIDLDACGTAYYRFYINEEDNYVVRLYVNTSSDYTRLAVKIDDKGPYSNYPRSTNGFEPRSAYWGFTANSIIVPLTKGEHTLVIYGESADLKIDKISIVKMVDMYDLSQVPSNTIQEGTAVMVPGMKLEFGDRTYTWEYFSGADYYCGFIWKNLTKLDGVVHLPVVLPPGTYKVFVKLTRAPIKVTLGGVTVGPVTPSDNDGNGLWTEMPVITTLEPTHYIIVTGIKNIDISERQQFLFYGVYITKNLKETMTSSDIAVDLTEPTERDNSPAVKGNLVANSSFEVGIDMNWGITDRQGTGSSFASMWDRTVGYDGGASIKIPPRLKGDSYNHIISRAYHIKPNKKYTLSVWAKASKPNKAYLVLSMINSYDPSGKSSYKVVNAKNGVLISDSWQRYSVTGYLLKWPSSDYHLDIFVSDLGYNNTTVWIDAIQFEEGDLTEYAPSNPVETMLHISQPGNVFYEDEPIEAVLYTYNASSSNQTKNLHFEIYDYMNRLVRQGSLTISLQPNERKTQQVDISPSRLRGAFRIVYWLENENGTEKELVYSVIPRPNTTQNVNASYMGVHPNFFDFSLDVITRLGIRWARAMSPAGFFRWGFEPQDSQFVWYDDEVQRAASRGITILGTIGEGWPSSADNGGLPDLDKWQEFVSQIVNHYKPWVKYWEIDNEPNWSFTPNFYAQMLKMACDAIEANDPQAKIIAMGGSNMEFMQQVVAELEKLYPGWNWKEHLYAFSAHAYPGGYGPEQFKTGIIDTLGEPVWNTEAGSWDYGFFFGDYSNFKVWGKQIWPFKDAQNYYMGGLQKVERVPANFIRSIGSGMTKYFYYDSRIIEYRISSNKTHCTFMESDDSVRPKGTAYAIAGYFIDYSTSLGSLTIEPNTFAYLFDKQGTPILALWTKDISNKTLTVSLSPSQFSVFDMMGNPISVSGNTIPYNRTPRYIVGNGISVEVFKNAIQNGVVRPATDSLSPNVLIASAPRGPVQAGAEVRIRWAGIDDTSIPDFGSLDPEMREPLPGQNPNALVYSYRLLGHQDSWSDWTAGIYHDYNNLPLGNYTFEVKAKDEAGNESEVARRAIIVGGGSNLLGDISGDNQISAYDAALAAQYSVGLISLTQEQIQKAEVSGDGLVSSYDAALIAQRAVGLIGKFPVES